MPNKILKTVQKLNRLLPLVAIGTIADCQSILDPTNRLITRAGISILNKNQHQIIGLEELMLQTGLRDSINNGHKLVSEDIAFSLSPILNSSGRVSHAELSISSILADNQDHKLPFNHPIRELIGNAKDLVSRLIETNETRKLEVKLILRNVEDQATAQALAGQKFIWIRDDEVSKGYIGLIASRLVNKTNLPTIILSQH
jgi:single-stranded-DNA-specific exonuclease